MWAYIFRRVAYNIPVFLGIVLFVMLALRVHDPVYALLGKNAKPEDVIKKREDVGLDKSFARQYVAFLCTFDLGTQSWVIQPGRTVGEIVSRAIIPSLSLTLPALLFTSILSICVGIIASYFRGRPVDRTLVLGAVLGMSVSFLVYIILGQYFGAFMLKQKLDVELFAISGYENWASIVPPCMNVATWAHYCLLPVMISVIVAMGYDTRFYRAVMVEESQRDYITTAKAKGASKAKVMFVHMLKNAMIPIITRVVISLPFLIMGSILLEQFFGIPGMGRTLIAAVREKDFPVVQSFTAIFSAIYIVTIILTDVLYALVDPRVRLS
jgi:peptide/nickel transport system permease protein